MNVCPKKIVFHTMHTSESGWVSYIITNPFQNVFFLLVMRYLVATGISATEIVDLSDPTMSCLLEDIPFRYGSAGGLLGTTPVICGGQDGSYEKLNDCLLYGTGQVITMSYKRMYHSSVALNTSMIWILGGNNGNKLDSTELITINGAVNGPILPEAIDLSCAVKFITTGDIYLVGGCNSSGPCPSNTVWVANPSNELAFTQGPSLISGRYKHQCGTMSIGTTKSIIVAAGGYNSNNDDKYLTSVEILDPLGEGNQWVPGK